MDDFKFNDNPSGKIPFEEEDFAPLMEQAPAKKKDDGTTIGIRGKKGKKNRDKGQAVMIGALPNKQVDYNKLFN